MAERKKSMRLYSGAYFYYEQPEKHKYDISDIAHGLSLVCRYTGQCKHHYSVAQHSVLVSYQVRPENALAGLLHDASEAYLGDVNTHLKALLPEYKVLEEKVERAISAQFNLPFPLPDDVKEADLRMLMTEKRDILTDPIEPDNGWPEHPPYEEFGIARLTPEDAKLLFLTRFEELTK